MTLSAKIVIRKYLTDARNERAGINSPAWRCIRTGLVFNAKTRNASYWQRMNAITAMRTRAA